VVWQCSIRRTREKRLLTTIRNFLAG
jgi:hypothetical protein